MDKIFILSNLRMLFISLLINNSDLKKIIFILDSSINCKLNSLYNVYYVKRGKGIVELMVFSILYFIIFIYISFKFHLKETVVYGADHISGAKFFLRRNDFYLIEDGSINYDPKSYQRSWKNRLFSIPVFGVHKSVKKIYLTQHSGIPEIIKDKVEVIDIKKLWENKSREEKDNILNFFNINDEKIFELKKRKFMLFTQPLSEDSILTENEKIELYAKILNKYDSSLMAIKPHPREKTDYSRYFNNVYIFNDSCPSEILDLLDINFDKVITLFSTAILQYPKDIVDFYGVECHPKLKEKFTKLNIFEVNCKL